MSVSRRLTSAPAPRRPAVSRAVWGVICANALAAVFVAGLLAVLGRAVPASAEVAPALSAPAAVAPAQALAPAASLDLSMTKQVTTGSGDNNIVFNGELVTYTIAITNDTAFTANNVNVIDTLPIDTLDDIVCQQFCEPIVEEQSIPEPLGGVLVITVTRQLSWTIAALPQGGVAQLVFTARVVGQADGTVGSPGTELEFAL